MDDRDTDANGASARGMRVDRLDSWKKIASYLKRDVREIVFDRVQVNSSLALIEQAH